jgi:hypothetical protein
MNTERTSTTPVFRGRVYFWLERQKPGRYGQNLLMLRWVVTLPRPAKDRGETTE